MALSLNRFDGLSCFKWIGDLSDTTCELAKGYGLANVELQVPVKPETVFQSGSVGKQFTATAVMMLVEEGDVS